MLKAAFASGGRRGAKEGLDVDLSYLTDRDSEIQFDWFERNESLVTPSSKPSRRRQFAGALLALAGGLALVALVIGAVTIIKWFVAWP